MEREQVRGKFIAFEGIDFSGKTTQVKKLDDFLRGQGFDVLLTREPGDGNLELRKLILNGEINTSPVIALFLFLADRALHVQNVIRTSLGNKNFVISDRFEGSTYAYQIFLGGLPGDCVRQANELATGGLKPDLTIVVDITREEAVRRREQRSNEANHYDLMKEEEQIKLRQAYLTLAKYEPNWVVVDGVGTEEEVQARIKKVLEERKII